MTDRVRADSTGEPQAEQSEEHESWLREAVHAPHPARLPKLGDLIGGKYRIEDLLGRGGMGVVFRARHVVSERQVAIKWMLRSSTDEQARRRFEREARAAGRIEHPNVVSLFDIGDDGDCSYLVMELLRGESLRIRLGRGPLHPSDAVDTLIPAMRGVAAAHRAGVVHRDLKPDNIFLCQESEGAVSTAKVLDFGISSIASMEAVDSTLTQEGTLLGSLAYMSPEQLRSPHEADARTDVYAFGVILYELLTGSLPFQGANHSALIVAIATTEPKRLSQIMPDVSAGLEAVVARAIARERDNRYPDIGSLIDALLPFASARASSGQFGAARQSVPRSSASVPDAAGSRAAIEPAKATAGDIVGGHEIKTSRTRIVLVAAAVIVFVLLSAWLGVGRDPAPSVVPRAVARASDASPALPQAPPQAVSSPAPEVPAAAAPEPPPPHTAAVRETVDKPSRARAARATNAARSRRTLAQSTPDTTESTLFSGRK